MAVSRFGSKMRRKNRISISLERSRQEGGGKDGDTQGNVSVI